MVKHTAENLKLVIKIKREIGQLVESFLKLLNCTGSLGCWICSIFSEQFYLSFKGWAPQTLVLNSGLYFFMFFIFTDTE